MGLVICLTAGYVVVQSIRGRRRHVSPLPLLLIAFGVLFDLLITESRAGEGLTLVVRSSDYTMPNLLLLLGIVIYACEHVPPVRLSLRPVNGLRLGGNVLVAALALFVVAQVILATEYGVAGGRVRHAALETDARVVVNSGHIPANKWACEGRERSLAARIPVAGRQHL